MADDAYSKLSAEDKLKVDSLVLNHIRLKLNMVDVAQCATNVEQVKSVLRAEIQDSFGQDEIDSLRDMMLGRRGGNLADVQIDQSVRDGLHANDVGDEFINNLADRKFKDLSENPRARHHNITQCRS